MKEECPVRVLVADAHPIVREGVTAILNRQPDMRVVAEAASSRQTVEAFRRHCPDVLLMDLQLPGGGLATIQSIRDEMPTACFLVLTACKGDEDIYQAIKAGARGYLLKTAPSQEIPEAIRVLLNGNTFLPPRIASLLAARMSRPELTHREKEVLTLLSCGKSNQEIGNALCITEGTVKAHVNSILSKFDVNDRTQAMLTAIKRGFVHLI